MMQKRCSKKTRLNMQAGLTLVEASIVLAIVSVIIAAVWTVSSVVYENARQYQANRQMQATVQNIRQLYARINAVTTATDVTCTLDAQAAFPIEMRVTQGTPCSSGTAKLNHPWASRVDGSVAVVNKLPTASTPSGFTVRFTNLPRKACIGLATKLTGGDITNLFAVRINGASVTPPVTIVTSTSSCNAPGDTNSIEWDFDIRA